MPYRVRKRGAKWCVLKPDGSLPSGGSSKQYCHDSEKKAKKQATVMRMKEAGVPTKNSDNPVVLLFDGVPPVEFTDEVASNALNGGYVEIIPRGQWFDKGGQLRDISQGVIDEFVDNWVNREHKGIRRTLVAVDENHEPRAIGWYRDVIGLPEPRGVGASFTWNEIGRKLLEEGRYAYFSPALYWELLDIRTGELVQNQIAGGAVTNSPYLTGATALYSTVKGVVRMSEQEGTINAEEVADSVFSRIVSLIGGGGGNGEAPPDGGDDIAALRAEFDALRTENESLRTSRESSEAQFTEQITTMQSELANAQQQRDLQTYRTLAAQSYNHLPGEQDALAGHLMWLFSVDSSEEQVHASFFTSLLASLDQIASEHFKVRGVDTSIASGASFEQTEQLVEQKMKDNPDMAYDDALSEVVNSNASLRAEYEGRE